MVLAERIRVLQLSYGSSLYGAERWVLTLIKHLDPERVETVVGCVLDADGPDLPLIDEAKRLGFETEVIDARRNLVASGVRGLRSAIRRLGIDVLHTHGVRQDVLGLLATVGLRCRKLSTPHGWEAQPSAKERLVTVLNKLAFLSFDTVAPLSVELRDSLRPFPIRGSRIKLIGNGVDLSEVEGAIPAALPWDGDRTIFTIGYIGRLIPGKGLEVLLEALHRQGDPSVRCLIVGEGPEQEKLEAQAARCGLQGRVDFLGYRADRLSYLKRFDLFVLPSYKEGTPRCLMEALAAGIPCAGSRIPGIEVVLQDGVTGYTFPAGDPAALAGVIRHTQEDKAKALTLAAAGKVLVHERFSASAMARAYEDLYADLVSRTSRGSSMGHGPGQVGSGRAW
jgi:glycosyltransferase involved in cell wall biosynthesis